MVTFSELFENDKLLSHKYFISATQKAPEYAFSENYSQLHAIMPCSYYVHVYWLTKSSSISSIKFTYDLTCHLTLKFTQVHHCQKEVHTLFVSYSYVKKKCVLFMQHRWYTSFFKYNANFMKMLQYFWGSKNITAIFGAKGVFPGFHRFQLSQILGELFKTTYNQKLYTCSSC